MPVTKSISLAGFSILLVLGFGDVVLINGFLVPRYMAEQELAPVQPAAEPRPAEPAAAPVEPKAVEPKEAEPRAAEPAAPVEPKAAELAAAPVEPKAAEPAAPAEPKGIEPKPLSTSQVPVGYVSFDPASSWLPKASMPLLGRVARIMLKKPHLSVVLHGHADERGNEDRNMALSMDRANRTAKYLISWRIDASRITVKGFGSRRPLVKGNIAAALAKNRRVEVIWQK